MPCCRGQNYDKFFNDKTAAKELRSYQNKGPRRATGRLLRLLCAAEPAPESVLDIGGGVGIVQHEFAATGAQVTGVDASKAYLAAAGGEARRRGYGDRWAGVEGDFVEVAANVQNADVVTLDKVICCYPDMTALVGASAAKAKKFYGIVVPKDGWGVRVLFAGLNLLMTILRWQFRGFVHTHRAIDTEVSRQGLQLRTAESGIMWSVRVYERA